MKKLIKSGVCGTHKQCIYALFTKDRSTVAAEEKEKKKKKRENADAARLSAIQTYTIPFFLPISWGSPFFMVCYILIFLCKLLKQYIKDTIFNPKF